MDTKGKTSVSEKQCCACSVAPKLIFSCSGGADVGALSDRAARELSREGAGKMFCLAGIGGRVPGILMSTEAASKILAIDGCPLDCARKSLEQAGIANFEHLRLTDLGLAKGSSEVSEENISRVVEQGKSRLA